MLYMNWTVQYMYMKWSTCTFKSYILCIHAWWNDNRPFYPWNKHVFTDCTLLQMPIMWTLLKIILRLQMQGHADLVWWLMAMTCTIIHMSFSYAVYLSIFYLVAPAYLSILDDSNASGNSTQWAKFKLAICSIHSIMYFLLTCLMQNNVSSSSYKPKNIARKCKIYIIFRYIHSYGTQSWRKKLEESGLPWLPGWQRAV